MTASRSDLLDIDDDDFPPEKDIFEGYMTKEPSENDVLCGRGGSINSHPGNERFRIFVEKRKRVYLTARFKREKRLIASSIVSEIRALKPPGRFLSRDSKTGMWRDIGDEKARDKTSQALRENAPSIRAEIETEINEQRAEMQRDDEHKVPPVTAPAHHPYYGGWGYPFYVYGHPPPPPPPPMHAPIPPHSYHPHPTTTGSQYDPYYHGYGTTPDPYLHPEAPKSALEQTAEMVTSRAESFKNWTKNSLSFGGGGGGGGNSANEGCRSVASSKPISYIHYDNSKKRRMVKFRDDDSRSSGAAARVRRVRHCYSPVHHNDSLVDHDPPIEDDNDLEPHRVDSIDQGNSSIIAQVAHYLVPTLGSWDLANIVCGNDTVDGFPSSSHLRLSTPSKPGMDESYNDDDEAVEWEGQEVQLVDERRGAQEHQGGYEMDSDRKHHHDHHARGDGNSIAFSSLGSCHSWIPEQFGSAASYFSFNNKSVGSGGSLDMDYSAGGSLGGNSLTKVFEHEPLDGDLSEAVSPNMTHRMLSRIPSWERNLRSKSPLSIGSEDDESLISKASSKRDDDVISPFNAATHAIHSIDEEDDMAWTRE